MSEEELAAKFIEHFEGLDLYKEVKVPQSSGVCDIVIKIHKQIIAVEVKGSFNLKVIYQALRNCTFANYSYVAIPRPKGNYNRESEAICKGLGIGVLYYHPEEKYPVWGLKGWKNLGNTSVQCAVAAEYRRKVIKVKLEDWMKRSVAGSVHGRMTAFKITLEQIREKLVAAGGSLPVKEIFKTDRYHYKTIASAKGCIVGLCKDNIIKEFTYKDGIFTIT